MKYKIEIPDEIVSRYEHCENGKPVTPPTGDLLAFRISRLIKQELHLHCKVDPDTVKVDVDPQIG